MSKQAIIFDMDGTLVDSSLALVNAINHVRSELYLPPMPSNDILSKINDHSINPAHYFYKSESFLPMHEKLFSEYYSKNHHNELALYEGVEEMMEELKRRDLKLAIATNAYRKSTLQSLSHLKIEHYFDSIVCLDDVKTGKPSPDMLYRAIDHLQIDVTKTVFIGDGKRDEMAAKSAEMDFLMVDWGFSKNHEAISSTKELFERIITL